MCLFLFCSFLLQWRESGTKWEVKRQTNEVGPKMDRATLGPAEPKRCTGNLKVSISKLGKSTGNKSSWTLKSRVMHMKTSQATWVINCWKAYISDSQLWCNQTLREGLKPAMAGTQMGQNRGCEMDGSILRKVQDRSFKTPVRS